MSSGFTKEVDKTTAKIMWDFKFETDRQLIVNQPDIAVVDK